MKQELRERFARLGPVQVIARVPSGSPANLVLRPADGLRHVKVIPAVEALAKRGMALIDAKRAVDAMVETGEAVAHVPTIEDAAILNAELRSAGIAVRCIAAGDADVVRGAMECCEPSIETQQP